MKQHEYINHINKNYLNLLKKIIMSEKPWVWISNNEVCLKINALSLSSTISFLSRSSLTKYKQLIEITAMDFYNKQTNRFSILYVLFSAICNSRLLLFIEQAHNKNVTSVSKLFLSANWLEREIWDLYGIFFAENKNLRRLLTDYGFNGNPLKKDFPLPGFVELFYSDDKGKIVYEPVTLDQEYRQFNLQNNWLKQNSI